MFLAVKNCLKLNPEKVLTPEKALSPSANTSSGEPRGPAKSDVTALEFDREASIHREGYSDLIGARVGHGDIAD